MDENAIQEIMEPYRQRIDELDDQIIDLLAERIAVIREVGALKYGKGIPASIPARIDEVRERNAARADDLGLDPELIRALYTTIIDYSCNLEEVIMDALEQAQKVMNA